MMAFQYDEIQIMAKDPDLGVTLRVLPQRMQDDGGNYIQFTSEKTEFTFTAYAVGHIPVRYRNRNTGAEETMLAAGMYFIRDTDVREQYGRSFAEALNHAPEPKDFEDLYSILRQGLTCILSAGGFFHGKFVAYIHYGSMHREEPKRIGQKYTREYDTR